jgi:hypothetical protein
MPISSTSAWKSYFANSKHLDSSNLVLKQIRDSISPSTPFSESFESISKNDGMAFISLDPSETEIQLFHHGTILGGSWTCPDKHFITILHSDDESKPVQILPKYIKDIKHKSHSPDEFALGMSDSDAFRSLRSPKQDFNYKNIIPIPTLLIKAFLDAPLKDPVSIGMKFFETMYAYDLALDNNTLDNLPDDDDDSEQNIDLPTDIASPELPISPTPITIKNSPVENPRFLANFIHVVQFCHLCSKGKIPAIHYKLASTPDSTKWVIYTLASCGIASTRTTKRQITVDVEDSDSDDDISSPDCKVSRTDKHLLKTILKINDNMDKQSLRSNQEREEKEPGFGRLVSYRKNLILNASAIPPFDSPADSPTEFYALLLSKKSQFKAKEALAHRLLMEKVSFNPGAAFVTCLWHAEFFWILPDSPSGNSVFFCPEAKSLNVSELEKERSFALVDKLKAGDLKKLSKQKLYLPSTVMDMVFMVQNLYSILFLCFGKSSHSASFLLGWGNHMFENRLMYSSLHAADPQFFAKVLFAIDSALQIHWRSCCTATDRTSVNDKV